MATAFERHIDMMKRFGIACLGLTEAEVIDQTPSPGLAVCRPQVRQNARAADTPGAGRAA